MFRRVSLFTLAVCLTVFASSDSVAQPKDAPKPLPPRAGEPLFCLYALEDFYRSSRSPDLGKDPFQAVSAYAVGRKNLYDPLRRRAESIKDANEIAKAFLQYGELVKTWEDEAKEMEVVRTQMNKDLGLITQAQSSRALGVGFLYGLEAYDRGSDDAFERGLAGALVEYSRTAPAADAARQRAVKAAQEANQKIHREASAKRLLIAEKHYTILDTLGVELEKHHGLEKSEFANKKPTGVPLANPFLVVAAARTQLAKKDPSPEDDSKAADDCVKAVSLVPSHASYNGIRAMMYSLAGRLANRACVAEAGTGGFAESYKPKAKKPKSAALSAKAWAGYLTNEPFDAKSGGDLILQQVLQSHCYSGLRTVFTGRISPYQLLDAFVVKDRRPGNFNLKIPARLTIRYDVSRSPEVWYDYARAASVLGDVDLSYYCLQTAVWWGFKDKARAENDADLNAVRNHAMTRDRFTDSFTLQKPFDFPR